jgi:hypothetical protein
MFVEGDDTAFLSSSLDGDGASREDVGVFATATKVDIDINLLAHSSAVGNGGPWQSSDETDMAGLLIRYPQYHYFMELDLAWILVTWFSIFARANMALLVIFLIRRQTTDKFRKENSEFVCPSKSYSASVDILSVS